MKRIRVDGLDVAWRVYVLDEARIDKCEHDYADHAYRDNGPAELRTENAFFGFRHGSTHDATRQKHEREDQEPCQQNKANSQPRERQGTARDLPHHPPKARLIPLLQALMGFVRSDCIRCN
jgi:hypothetical protein